MNAEEAHTSASNPLEEEKAELRALLEGKQFSSQDDLQAQVDEFYRKRNQTALGDFQGLSPDQMYRMLYFPFNTPHLVTFARVLSVPPSAPAIALFSLLAEAMNEGGLKSTATGNLPRTFCREAAQSFWGLDEYDEKIKYGGINTEIDFFDLHVVRLTAGLAGLLRKYKGRYVLTRKSSGILTVQGMEGIYPLLLEAYIRKFNWAYRDRYPEPGFIQQSFLFSLYLLTKHGANWQSSNFYEDCFLRAFPQVLEGAQSRPLSSPEETMRSCYTWRCLVNCAGFFGLADVEPVSTDILNREYRIKKLPLLEHTVQFHFTT